MLFAREIVFFFLFILCRQLSGTRIFVQCVYSHVYPLFIENVAIIISVCFLYVEIRISVSLQRPEGKCDFVNFFCNNIFYRDHFVNEILWIGACWLWFAQAIPGI